MPLLIVIPVTEIVVEVAITAAIAWLVGYAATKGHLSASRKKD